MSKEEMIDQLISLKHHCLTMDDEIFKDDAKAIEGVLDLVNKQNKIIDKMADYILKREDQINNVLPLDLVVTTTKEQIIENFYKEVENE